MLGWWWAVLAVLAVSTTGVCYQQQQAGASSPYERESAALTKAALSGTDFSKLEYLCDTFGPRFSYLHAPPQPSFYFNKQK
jgi:hypothetical protein